MTTILQGIPLAAYPLGAGLLFTSSLFFGNVGLSLAGPVPLVKNELGAADLSAKSRLQVWRLFFDAAAYYVVLGTASTVALHLSVPLLTSQPTVRNYAVASAVVSASAIAYTVAAIQPTNKRLKTLDRQDTLTDAEGQEADRLIRRWDRLHGFRMVIYAGAWVTGLRAFVAALA